MKTVTLNLPEEVADSIVPYLKEQAVEARQKYESFMVAINALVGQSPHPAPAQKPTPKKTIFVTENLTKAGKPSKTRMGLGEDIRKILASANRPLTSSEVTHVLGQKYDISTSKKRHKLNGSVSSMLCMYKDNKFSRIQENGKFVYTVK